MTAPALAHHKARVRLGGWAIAVGVILALGTHTALILAGIVALFAGVALILGHGVTKGMCVR